MIGVFHPGTSVVHRAPALAKLGLLAVAVTVVALLPSLGALGIAAGFVAVLFLLARIPARLAWRQITPILWLLAFAVPVQWIFAGWEAASTMGLRLVLAVLQVPLGEPPVAVGVPDQEHVRDPVGDPHHDAPRAALLDRPAVRHVRTRV